MNPKLLKLNEEIDKTTNKLNDLQNKLDNLKAQRLELENTEILELVRSITATPEELATFIKAYKVNQSKNYKFSHQEETQHDQI